MVLSCALSEKLGENKLSLDKWNCSCYGILLAVTPAVTKGFPFHTPRLLVPDYTLGTECVHMALMKLWGCCAHLSFPPTVSDFL